VRRRRFQGVLAVRCESVLHRVTMQYEHDTAGTMHVFRLGLLADARTQSLQNQIEYFERTPSKKHIIAALAR
jgi:hypothetical protein